MNNDYELIGKYEQGQTPQERLNNLLSPFFTLADIVNTEQFTASTSEVRQKLQDIIKDCAKTCSQNKQLVRDYLHDIPIFYNK